MNRILQLAFLILCISSLARAQQKAVLTASAASCSVSNASCLIYGVDQSAGAATFTVSANASGNTLQFEASGDNGTTWVALNVTPSNSTTAVTSTTGTGTWQANVAGYTQARIRMSTLVGGTSTVSIITSIASARSNGGGGGSVPNTPGIPPLNGNVFFASNYGVNANAIGVNLCNGTSGLFVVTCTTNGNFIATDVGKVVWASATANATPDLSPTTIQAVNSATQITTVAALTRTMTNGQLTYGTDQTANLNTFWTAVTTPQDCGSAVFPAGGMIWSAAVMLLNPAHCNFGQAPYPMQLLGQGYGQTAFYMSPAFVFNSTSQCAATVTGNNSGCWGPGNAFVMGIEWYTGTQNNVLFANTYNGPIWNITTPGYWLETQMCCGIVPGTSTGVNINSGAATIKDFYDFSITGNGASPCTSLGINAADVRVDNVYILSQCNAAAGNVITVNTAGGQYTTRLDHISGLGGNNAYPVLIEGGGTAVLNDLNLGQGVQVTGAGTQAKITTTFATQNAASIPFMIDVLSGASVTLSNSTMTNAAATTADVGVDSTSTFIDGCGNVLTGNATATVTSGGKFIPCVGTTYVGTSQGIPTATGTGACASPSTQTGNIFSGSLKCPGTTGASTVTLTFPITEANGWNCQGIYDSTTYAVPTALTFTQTTCVATFASVTANDIISFKAQPF